MNEIGTRSIPNGQNSVILEDVNWLDRQAIGKLT